MMHAVYVVAPARFMNAAVKMKLYIILMVMLMVWVQIVMEEHHSVQITFLKEVLIIVMIWMMTAFPMLMIVMVFAMALLLKMNAVPVMAQG